MLATLRVQKRGKCEASPIKNRVTEMAGVDYPILQAPMGWIARPVGFCGIKRRCDGHHRDVLGDFDAIKGEVAKMHEMTDKPFGMNGHLRS